MDRLKLLELVKEHAVALLADDEVDEVKIIVVSEGTKFASWEHRDGVEKVLSRSCD